MLMRRQRNENEEKRRNVSVHGEEEAEEEVEVTAKPVETIGEVAERPTRGQGLTVSALIFGLVVGAVVAGFVVHRVDQAEVRRIAGELDNVRSVAHATSLSLRNQAVDDLNAAIRELGENNFGDAATMAMQARERLKAAFSLDPENQRLADSATSAVDQALSALLPPFKKAEAQKKLSEAIGYIKPPATEISLEEETSKEEPAESAQERKPAQKKATPKTSTEEEEEE